MLQYQLSIHKCTGTNCVWLPYPQKFIAVVARVYNRREGPTPVYPSVVSLDQGRDLYNGVVVQVLIRDMTFTMVWLYSYMTFTMVCLYNCTTTPL